MPPLRVTCEQLTSALEGRYIDIQPLRAGGQAIVFKAQRLVTKERAPAGELVALKLFTRLEATERIEREVGAMMRIRHATLANLIEHGTVTLEHTVVRYVASEFVEGEALDHRIVKGPVPPPAVAAIGRDIGTAIEEIWTQLIVHRDVSPKNVMLRTGERDAVLIDLGIAKHLSQTRITTQGTVWGTTGYMSPEQWDGTLELACASDIFALGVVLVEALAGRHPTEGDQHDLLQRRIVVADLVPNAPAGLVQLAQRMLSMRSSFRPLPGEVAKRCTVLAATL
jgi:eukaryotic-like serine/threonine-protein kinase